MKSIRYILPLLLLLLTGSVSAQKLRTVTGLVTDEKSEPLIGATVKAQDGKQGTVTDLDGKFTLKVDAKVKMLQVSYVGYNTRIVPIARGEMKIVLKEEANSLNEMVVIGYGAVKKGSVTAAIANVKADDLKDRPVSNVASALQGNLAGVEVRSTSGAPGSGVTINVRGATSINDNASSSPLYVVDGVPMDDSFDLSELNTDDIASIEVLKDASSSAIYGSRGANGVIIITSKKADKSGKSTLKFNANFGLQQAERFLDVMTPQEWIAWRTKANNQRYINAYGSKGATVNDDFDTRLKFSNSVNYVNDPRWTMPGYGGLALVDWQNEIFRLATYQNYQLSTTAGNDRGNYRLSVGYANQDGIVVCTNFKRLNAQFTGETKIKDRITFGLKIAPSVSWTETGNVDGKDNSAMNALLLVPVAEGEAGKYSGAQPYTRYLWAGSQISPVSMMEEQQYKNEKVSIATSAYVNFQIMKGLQAQVLGAWNYNDTKLRRFLPSTLNRYWADYPEGYYSNGTWTGTTGHKFLGQGQLTWDKTWGDHYLNMVAGWSVESKNNSYSYTMKASQYPNNAIPGFDILNEQVTEATAKYNTDDHMVSYFVRAIYNYADRYLINASLRRDGSSRFGANNRWGTFPAVSAAWRVTNEPFWPKNKVLTDAKMRFSYGANGSNSLPVSSANGLLGSVNYSSDGSIITGYIPTSLENPDLTWQKTHSWDLAFDLGFWKNRLSLSADFYVKTITDMLYNISLPSNIGFAKGYSNIGNIQTKGVEIELKSNNLTGPLKWTTTFNMAYTRSIVKSLGANSTIYCGYQNKTQVIEVGKRVGEYYLYDAVGVYQTKADLENYPKQATSSLGSVRYRDVSGPEGKPDNVIDEYDRVYAGHPSPDFTYGLTNTFKYKNFDFSFLITAQTGGKIYAMLGRGFDRQGMGTSINTLKKYQHMWFSEEDPGDGVTPCAWNTSTTEEYDTRWLYSSDFIKLKNITLGYTVPLKRGSFVTGLRINASVENVFQIDNYEGGYSPESNNSNSLVSNYDYGAYPMARVYSIGLNITF